MPAGQPFNPKTDTFYGYLVDPNACIAFIVLFSITGVLHLGQSIYHRVWWLIPTMFLCALGEVVGWIGRYWSYKNYGSLNAFLMQICATILAPSFMAAGLFFILGTLTNRLGVHYVFLRPKIFSIIFVTCDVIALVIQAIGGANASISFTNGKDPEPGAKIMVGGIIFQIVALSLYVITAVEFLIRYTLDKPARHPSVVEHPNAIRRVMTFEIKQMIVGTVLATILLYVRSIYRTIELLNGWTGPVIHNQALFNYMDALPIVLALLTLNLFNPGRLLFGRNRSLVPQVDTPVAAVSDAEKNETV